MSERVVWNKGLKGEDNPLYGRRKTKKHKKKISIATKKLWKDQDYRRNHVKAIREYHATEEYRRNVSEGAVEAHSDPDKYRTKILEKPLICSYCEDLITKTGITAECLVYHSLNGNHDNWSSGNKVPVHRRYHPSLHVGDK